jgi:DNA-binding transcriptional MerR regulator
MARNTFTIGVLARETGVKPVTIRYYEKSGLLPAPARTGGNYRLYSGQHAQRLRFIRKCRELGFSLDQIRDLLRLSSEKNQPCEDINRVTGRRLAEVEKKLQDLRRLAAELRRLNRSCRGGGLVASCRIIEALSP